MYHSVRDVKDIRFPKYFIGGKINITHNALDRHINEGRGDMPCFFEVSAYTGVDKTYTYSEVRDEVGRLATVI